MIRASEVAVATAALLWLDSAPWYPRQPWIVRADEALILLFALMVAVVVMTAVSRGLEQLDRLVPALDFKTFRLTSQERQESIMTSGTVTTAVDPEDRRAILHYATRLLDYADRTPDAVITAAQPLLEWAAAAPHQADQIARMAAMARADQNEGARRSADRSPDPTWLSPGEFLASARAYYAFLTAETGA